MVKKMIGPQDVVLEIGGRYVDIDEAAADDHHDYRYATTTCEVAVMQNNSGAVIAVEPDHRVWAAAEVSSCLLIH